MAHLNLYLPDDVAESLKEQANAANVPLSRLVLSLLPVRGPGDEWPPDYFTKTCGFLIGDVEEPQDSLPEPVETLD